jgi:hypothetical protein
MMVVRLLGVFCQQLHIKVFVNSQLLVPLASKSSKSTLQVVMDQIFRQAGSVCDPDQCAGSDLWIAGSVCAPDQHSKSCDHPAAPPHPHHCRCHMCSRLSVMWCGAELRPRVLLPWISPNHCIIGLSISRSIHRWGDCCVAS